MLLALISSPSLANKIEVKVGAGIRPPFLLPDGKGMGPEIITAFNLIQDDFHFELVSVPIARRVTSLESGLVDIVMWDNVNWGWNNIESLTASMPLLYSEDRFVTHSSNTTAEDYFNNFAGKSICGVNGYHYVFLNFETDYKAISKHLNITLVRTEEESIKMALNKRCDISVASLSAINWFFTVHPDARSQLTVSTRLDSTYTRHFLIPAYAPISADEINSIFLKANTLGLIEPIYKRYGQSVPQMAADSVAN
ncbi:MAG: transporter substrate-binding domain-containing protein [Pseudomonadota bacterium]